MDLFVRSRNLLKHAGVPGRCVVGHAGGQDMSALPQRCGCHSGPQVLSGLLQMVSSALEMFSSLIEVLPTNDTVIHCSFSVTFCDSSSLGFILSVPYRTVFEIKLLLKTSVLSLQTTLQGNEY